MTLSRKEVQKIVNTFLKNHGNVHKTAKQLGHHDKTVGKYVVKRGFKVKKNHKYGDNPIDYYMDNLDKFAGLSRSDICYRYPGLYHSLLKYGQLDFIVPRLYRGFETPLDYFIAHADEYSGMSRTQLRYYDCGLYSSLLEYGQLDEAISPRSLKAFREFETPLDYFIAHADEYSGMSRTQLSKKDNYLYTALLEWNQLDEAILRYDRKRSVIGRKGGKAKPLSKSDLDRIVNSYTRFDGNPVDAARHLPYSEWRIRRVWNNFNLKTIGTGNWRKSYK